MELLILSEGKLIVLSRVMNNPGEINNYFKNNLSEQNRDLRGAHIKSIHEMEELKRVQKLRVDESSRRRLIKSQDTIHELTARIQELQNVVNCMHDLRDSKDAESVRSAPSHAPSLPALFPLYRDPGGMLSRPGRMPNRNDRPRDIWNTQGISENVFAIPPASSSSPYLGGFNPWISNVTEHITVCTIPLKTNSNDFGVFGIN